MKAYSHKTAVGLCGAAILLVASPAFAADKPMAAIAPAPAAVEEYAIHEDGGLIYDPLRREAAHTDQLARYAQATSQKCDLSSAGFTLRAWVPRAANAYDVVPITYELSWEPVAGETPARFPVAVEATAFEEENRRAGRDLFDLALPGRLDLNVEYLGSVTAKLTPGARHNLTADCSDTPGVYPPFARRPLVRSGVVEAGDLVWFRFRYSNTGNTILDPEGLGGWQFYPELCRKNRDGAWAVIGHPYNLYYRDLEYLYPGESREIWMHFQTQPSNETPQNFGLLPGEYLIRVKAVYRNYKQSDTFFNIWEGPTMFVWEMPITVEKEPRDAPVPAGRKTRTDGGDPDKITRFIHTFEEFMTAFDCHQSPPAAARPLRKIRGTLHLQVAPWTKHVVVKLIATGPVAIASVAVPVEVDSETLRIAFRADPKTCLVKGGRLEPIIYSQTMADMRANVQLGPFPERHIRERLREMKDCGINVVCTTSMPWLYDDMDRPKSNYQGDAFKYFLDLARDEGLTVEGWGTYPYDGINDERIAAWITDRPLTLSRHSAGGYYPAISHTDPGLPLANAAIWQYQFRRWGDLYWQNAAGDVPLGVEDTRGWMRQDINVRLPMGELTVKAFREWARSKYGSLQAINAAWGTRFAALEEIAPEKGRTANQFGHCWEYIDPAQPFHDWNRAVADLDTFRTELRIRNYRETLAKVREEIPNATVVLRTEGANVVTAGLNPGDPNPHLRHIYYSQRRNALIAEQIQACGLFKYHADYTTMPYTPSELRSLVRAGARQGVIPAYLPQFDNMRDIAINVRYGSDYQIHYNLPAPRKGYMMHCLTALYPWFAAMYEEGGIPGILWEDYQCDGFATETQKREMRFFLGKLRAAMARPEARAAGAAEAPAQQWREGTRGLRCYRLE
jgi:hypothetical protein